MPVSIAVMTLPEQVRNAAPVRPLVSSTSEHPVLVELGHVNAVVVMSMSILIVDEFDHVDEVSHVNEAEHLDELLNIHLRITVYRV
jgi:hypothetical protein